MSILSSIGLSLTFARLTDHALSRLPVTIESKAPLILPAARVELAPWVSGLLNLCRSISIKFHIVPQVDISLPLNHIAIKFTRPNCICNLTHVLYGWYYRSLRLSFKIVSWVYFLFFHWVRLEIYNVFFYVVNEWEITVFGMNGDTVWKRLICG